MCTLCVLFVCENFSQINYSKYYPLEEGASFQYTLYDKKGKPERTTDYKVTKVENSGDKTVAKNNH